jgi:hypothetical protein
MHILDRQIRNVILAQAPGLINISKVLAQLNLSSCGQNHARVAEIVDKMGLRRKISIRTKIRKDAGKKRPGRSQKDHTLNRLAPEANTNPLNETDASIAETVALAVTKKLQTLKRDNPDKPINISNLLKSIGFSVGGRNHMIVAPIVDEMGLIRKQYPARKKTKSAPKLNPPREEQVVYDFTKSQLLNDLRSLLNSKEELDHKIKNKLKEISKIMATEVLDDSKNT